MLMAHPRNISGNVVEFDGETVLFLAIPRAATAENCEVEAEALSVA